MREPGSSSAAKERACPNREPHNPHTWWTGMECPGVPLARVAADRLPDPAPSCGNPSCIEHGVDRHQAPVSAAVSPAEPPEEFRTLHRDFPDLIDRLHGRAMAADANGQGITAALHAEAADAIEELCAALSEDRQLRWRLRARLDAALWKKEQSDV